MNFRPKIDEGNMLSLALPGGALLAGIGVGGAIYYLANGKIPPPSTGLPIYLLMFFWLYTLYLAFLFRNTLLKTGLILLLLDEVVRWASNGYDSPSAWLVGCSLFFLSGALFVKAGISTSSFRRRGIALLLFVGFAAARYFVTVNWINVVERRGF